MKSYYCIQGNGELIITSIFKYLGTFLSNPTHWYIIIGGTLLAITIALGRYDVAV